MASGIQESSSIWVDEVSERAWFDAERPDKTRTPWLRIARMRRVTVPSHMPPRMRARPTREMAFMKAAVRIVTFLRWARS